MYDRAKLNVAVGVALRRARHRSGLTLRQVAERSGGRFQATSIASYERSERAIGLARFCELCDLYATHPGTLLGDIIAAEKRSSSVGAFDDVGAPDVEPANGDRGGVAREDVGGVLPVPRLLTHAGP